jgi:hypothetical protein
MDMCIFAHLCSSDPHSPPASGLARCRVVVRFIIIPSLLFSSSHWTVIIVASCVTPDIERSSRRDCAGHRFGGPPPRPCVLTTHFLSLPNLFFLFMRDTFGYGSRTFHGPPIYISIPPPPRIPVTYPYYLFDLALPVFEQGGDYYVSRSCFCSLLTLLSSPLITRILHSTHSGHVRIHRS